MNITHARIAPLVLAALATSAPAGVIVVDAQGGGAFTDLQSAANAAVSGDILLVKSGGYAGLNVTGKSLVVAADADAIVTIQNGVGVSGLTAAQSFVLSGLAIHGGTAKHALQVTNSAGPVRIESCSLFGADGAQLPPTGDICAFCEDGSMLAMRGGSGTKIVNSVDVSFAGCQLRGGIGFAQAPCSRAGGDGIDASASFVTVYESSCQGGRSGLEPMSPGSLDCINQGAHGGAGARVQGVGIFAAGSTFVGGRGGNGDPSGGTAGNGGDGLRLIAGAAARLLDNSFTGGAPGLFFGGVNGLPISGSDVFQHAGIAPDLVLPRVVRDNVPLAATCSGEAGSLVSVLSSAQSNAAYIPSQRGVRVPRPRALPQATPLLQLGHLNAGGSLDANLGSADLPPGAARVVYSQSMNRTALGQITLGTPRVVIVLDAVY